ncbi:MAG: hypothetical protein ACTHLN_11670, partial [Tepidisphaeraceae bacterium]
PLLASALAIEGRGGCALWIAVDLIMVTKALTARVRERLSTATDLPPSAILLSATHTHSGPVTASYLSNEYDATVPPPDAAYLKTLEDAIVDVGTRAWENRHPAEFAIVQANATGIGTCRHDPKGPCDLSVPVIVARDVESKSFIGLMLVCAMHPTVLHEDSTLYSGDFPALARQYLQRHLVGEACPIVYHTGASGNQSPRHVTRGNTFAEARRLGGILGRAVENALRNASYSRDLPLTVAQTWIELPLREPPPLHVAEQQCQHARARLNALQGPHASAAERRSAECDWFGAEELVAIARAAEQGRLQSVRDSILPAEIQVFRLGHHLLIAWPGEFFLEFALRIKEAHPHATIITLANGELQGYVVTQEAIDKHWYEAGNALLKSPDAGDRMVSATRELIESLPE